MTFKRASVRYSTTPEPATPYQAAQQLWDERIGSARVQARNWRLMAFGCLSLAVVIAAGFIRDVRSVPLDPIVLRDDWLEAYDYTTERGATTLNEHARANDPFAHVGQ